MKINQEAFDKYVDITGIDLGALLSDFIDFTANNSADIESYYAGKVEKANTLSFLRLNELIGRFRVAIDIMSMNKESFSYMADFELLETLEELHLKLLSLSNSSKFMRSSVKKGSFTNAIEIDYTLGYNESLEQLHKKVTGSSQGNGWIDIALRNELKEEDYTPEGGVMLRASISPYKFEPIQSVIDVLDESNVLGKDIDRKFRFEGNDIKVLPPDETFEQAVDILANMKKGDNPEFPTHGKNPKFAVGSNIASLQFPVVFREMYETFSNDDTISYFALTNVKVDQNSVIMSYEVKPRLGFPLKKDVSF